MLGRDLGERITRLDGVELFAGIRRGRGHAGGRSGRRRWRNDDLLADLQPRRVHRRVRRLKRFDCDVEFRGDAAERIALLDYVFLRGQNGWRLRYGRNVIRRRCRVCSIQHRQIVRRFGHGRLRVVRGWSRFAFATLREQRDEDGGDMHANDAEESDFHARAAFTFLLEHRALWNERTGIVHLFGAIGVLSV